jgi:mannosyltransferase
VRIDGARCRRPVVIPAADHRPALVLAAVAAVLILGAALRAYDLGGKSMWVDEANSVVLAGLSPGELVARLARDSSPPLYYLVLGAWMAAFGASEIAVRSLSVCGGILTIWASFLVGRRLFTAEVGLVAAALVAVSPLQIFHSQQARMNAWLPLVALLGCWWLWRAVDTPRTTHLAGWVVSLVVALYLHNAALYLLPAHAVVVAATGAFRRRPLRWLLGFAAVALGYAPWLPVLMAQLGNREQYAWFRPFWARLGPGGVAWMTAAAFAPTLPGVFYRFAVPHPAPWWLPVAMLAAAGGAVVRAVSAHDAEPRRRIGAIVACCGVPLAAAVVVSMVLTPSYVPGRTDQVVLGPYFLLVAVGLTAIRPAAVRWAAVAALCAAAVPSLAAYYGNDWERGDRALAAAIARDARPGDTVVCTSLSCATLAYYLPRLDVPVHLVTYPTDAATHLANLDEAALAADPGHLEDEARRVRDAVADTTRPGGRLFLVLVPVAYNGPLVNALVTEQPLKLGDFRQAGTGAPVQLWLLRR